MRRHAPGLLPRAPRHPPGPRPELSCLLSGKIAVMPYTLAIFDFDGTLADTLPAFAAHFAAASDHFGFRKIQPEEIDALRQLSARQIIAHLGIPLWKLPLIARFIHRRIQAEVATLRLFPGAATMLRHLREA